MKISDNLSDRSLSCFLCFLRELILWAHTHTQIHMPFHHCSILAWYGKVCRFAAALLWCDELAPLAVHSGRVNVLSSCPQFFPDPDPFIEGKHRHWAAGLASCCEECWPCGRSTSKNKLNRISHYSLYVQLALWLTPISSGNCCGFKLADTTLDVAHMFLTYCTVILL